MRKGKFPFDGWNVTPVVLGSSLISYPKEFKHLAQFIRLDFLLSVSATLLCPLCTPTANSLTCRKRASHDSSHLFAEPYNLTRTLDRQPSFLCLR